MANFKTHLLVAATISGIASVGVIATDIVETIEVARYFPLGVAGGLLPDIDSDHSTPTKIFFALLALSGAFWAVLWGIPSYSLAELVLIWVGVFLLLRYVVFEAFSRLTVHRGVFHSILASLFFGLLTTNISYHLFHCDSLTSWMSGCFVVMGYLVHLSLDELYSVDLMNNRLKKSFGTALKLISLNNIKASILMSLLTLSLYSVCPDANPFISRVNTMIDNYSDQDKWLPKNNRWFTSLPSRLLNCTSS